MIAPHAAMLRLVGLLVISLSASAAAGPTPAKRPAGRTVAKQARPAVRVVRANPETGEVVLFDEKRKTQVTLTVGEQALGYTLIEVDDTTVTLGAKGAPLVLAIPPPPPILDTPAPAPPRKPATSGPVPAPPGARTPAMSGPGPATVDRGPATSGRAPVTVDTRPVTSGPAPATVGPVTSGPAPATIGATTPVTSGPAPASMAGKPVVSVPAARAGDASIAGAPEDPYADGDVPTGATGTGDRPPATGHRQASSPARPANPDSVDAPDVSDESEDRMPDRRTPDRRTPDRRTPDRPTADSRTADRRTADARDDDETDRTTAPDAADEADTPGEPDARTADNADSRLPEDPYDKPQPPRAANDPIVVELTRRDLEAATEDFGSLVASVRGTFTRHGARIERVTAGSLLARCGLRAGDLITAIDGKPLRSLDDAAELYARAGSLRRLTVRLVRADKPLSIVLVIRP